MKVVCVAVVGKTQNPLYIKSYDQTEGLKFHYMVHGSLDVVEEKLKKSTPTTELYMGLLYPTEDYKVYGYITNTKIKLIVVVLDDADLKEVDIKNFFKRFHQVFAGTVCNPFYTPDDVIKVKKFDTDVDNLVYSVASNK